jgi:putative intracellular protease/amidase
MKICIIGAGSTYTPELIEGIINKRDSLPLTELDLMDIDERKLNIVGSLCQRMIEAAGLPCKTRLVLNDYEEALKGAECMDFPVVRDMNIITSQGPATAMRFALALVSYFKGKEVADELEEDLLMI